MPGARVGESPVVAVVDREHDGGELGVRLALEGSRGDLQRHARLAAAGLQVGAQRVAHKRRHGQGLPAVAADVADDDRHPVALHLEDVVEVAAGCGALGGPVRHRRLEGADPRRDLG